MASNGVSANLIVISPVVGGPADRAGVMPGDKILAINGTSTQGMGLYDAAEQLQGPEDSVVELTLHKGDSESRIVSLKREKNYTESCELASMRSLKEWKNLFKNWIYQTYHFQPECFWSC